MKREKLGTIITLILILSFPFVSMFTIHQFIEHPYYWKKTIAFFKGAKYLGEEEIILQLHSNDCGPAALKMIFDYFQIPVSLEEISKIVLTERGSTMLSLKEMAELKGLKAEGWKYAFKDLKKIKLPAIAFVNDNHYVVISEITEEEKIIVLDPAIGKLEYNSIRFRRIWNGEALIFRANQEVSIKQKKLENPIDQIYD